MSDQAGTGSKITPRHIIIAIVAILVLVFAFMNNESAPVNLFGWHLTMPLWLLVIIVYLLGMLTGSWARKGVRYMSGKEKK